MRQLAKYKIPLRLGAGTARTPRKELGCGSSLSAKRPPATYGRSRTRASNKSAKPLPPTAARGKRRPNNESEGLRADRVAAVDLLL